VADASLIASQAPPAGQGLVRQVRFGTRDDGSLRVVLDINGDVQSKSFAVAPNESYGHRLVIDLAPSVEPAPVKVEHAPPQDEARDLVVAVDAGHGGDDPGAIGRGGTREKDVALAIARALIHADSIRDRSVSGSSVYILSPRGASDEAARWLAERENASDLIGGVSLDDKDGVLASVLLDLSQTASISASMTAAERVLIELDRVGQVRKPAVQQAGFLVLKSPDIPSMLIETAYISNPGEERRLKDRRHQAKLADAIHGGIRGYFYENPPPGSRVAALVAQRSVADEDRAVIAQGGAADVEAR
jgi:N-acetylmuramoyl-L-alanine amidase